LRLPWGDRTGFKDNLRQEPHRARALNGLAGWSAPAACPVAALRAWLEAAGITEGAIFRRVFNKHAQRVTDRRLAARNVATIVKAAAAKLGLEAEAFAGHSLRAGFVTSAVKRGANLIKITDVTGHRSLEMLKTYSRDAEAFIGHAGAGLL
jgi:site-specific recombinase XerC